MHFRILMFLFVYYVHVQWISIDVFGLDLTIVDVNCVNLVLFVVVLFLKFKHTPLLPISVNFHFTRTCNLQCSYCFFPQHTTTERRSLLHVPNMKKCLQQLQSIGMERINFSGGEPLMYPAQLGELLKFCKSELNVATAIVSNGTLLTREWLLLNAQYLDVLAVSLDSFHYETNDKIGRSYKSKNKYYTVYLDIFNIAEICRELNIKFKINTVVSSMNAEEIMVDSITKLNPFRWKVFQCLSIENENNGIIRDCKSSLVTPEQYKKFCQQNWHKNIIVEDNETMIDSYFIVDENFKFLFNQNGNKVATDSILEVGAANAFNQMKFRFNAKNFRQRKAVYQWVNDW